MSNPLWKVVDGPFRLKYFSASNGAYELVPNVAYSLRPKAHASEVSVLTFKAPASMLQALRSHRLQIGSLDPSTQLGAIKKLKRDGVSVFGGPGWGWFGGVINFKDRTDDFDKVIAQQYIRGVIPSSWIRPRSSRTFTAVGPFRRTARHRPLRIPLMSPPHRRVPRGPMTLPRLCRRSGRTAGT